MLINVKSGTSLPIAYIITQKLPVNHDCVVAQHEILSVVRQQFHFISCIFPYHPPHWSEIFSKTFLIFSETECHKCEESVPLIIGIQIVVVFFSDFMSAAENSLCG